MKNVCACTSPHILETEIPCSNLELLLSESINLLPIICGEPCMEVVITVFCLLCVDFVVGIHRQVYYYLTVFLPDHFIAKKCAGNFHGFRERSGKILCI